MSPRRSRRRKLPLEPIEVNVESLSHEGRGVARIDCKVAFVEGALAGETVLARYVHSRSQFDVLSAEQIFRESRTDVEGFPYGGVVQNHKSLDKIELKE